MWPFKRKPPPTRYAPIDYQVGDKVVCVNDAPHCYTHQRLLGAGEVYEVRHIDVDGVNGSNFSGPFVQVVGIVPVNDSPWGGLRFRKVLTLTNKSSITERVLTPVFTPKEVVRERAEGAEIYSR